MSFKHKPIQKGVPVLAGILFLFSGCATLVEKPPEILWHQCYQAIEDRQAQEFLQAGIASLKAEYGAPDLAINEVMLRYSKKDSSAHSYRIAEYFSRTELVDSNKGVFCIYIGVPPDREQFYYLLGHEIAHLQHPTRIDDPEMERFCNEFSRRLCEKEGRLFNSRWENRKWVLRPKG